MLQQLEGGCRKPDVVSFVDFLSSEHAQTISDTERCLFLSVTLIGRCARFAAPVFYVPFGNALALISEWSVFYPCSVSAMRHSCLTENIFAINPRETVVGGRMRCLFGRWGRVAGANKGQRAQLEEQKQSQQIVTAILRETSFRTSLDSEKDLQKEPGGNQQG